MCEAPASATVNNADASSARGLAFVPKDTVNVVIGKQNANIYPKIETMWNVEERAYAFRVTSAALKNLHLATDVYVDSLGVFLDSQTIVAGLKSDFYNHALKITGSTCPSPDLIIP
jgi:hypothetical protein